MYDVIYADPPWLYSNKTFKTLNVPYPMMSLNDICSMKVPTKSDAVLFLWVTSPILPWAFEVIKSWGFKYKQIIIWDKCSNMVGFNLQNRVEILLYCTKGKIKPVRLKKPNLISIKRKGRHSTKPDIFIELIEEMFPSSSKLELFARREREGWDAFGNEINNSIKI